MLGGDFYRKAMTGPSSESLTSAVNIHMHQFPCDGMDGAGWWLLSQPVCATPNLGLLFWLGQEHKVTNPLLPKPSHSTYSYEMDGCQDGNLVYAFLAILLNFFFSFFKLILVSFLCFFLCSPFFMCAVFAFPFPYQSSTFSLLHLSLLAFTTSFSRPYSHFSLFYL